MSDPDYTITFVKGTTTVKAATLTVTASGATRAYGATNPAFTATDAGFVNLQTLATSGVSGAPSCTTTATATSAPGNYPITCTLGTLSAGNYSFVFVPGTLVVTKSPTSLVVAPVSILGSVLGLTTTFSSSLRQAIVGKSSLISTRSPVPSST